MKSLWQRIRALKNLQDDWDSQGARAPQIAALSAAHWYAHRFIRHADEGLVQAHPTSDGGVALSALDCSGDEVNIEFRPDGTWNLDDCEPLSEGVKP